MKEARKRLVQARVLRSVCQKALTFGGLLGPNREVNTDAVDSLFRKFDR